VIGPLEDRVVPAGITRSVAARIQGARYVPTLAPEHSVSGPKNRPPSPELMANFLEEERAAAGR
jgi:hypothetical protein